MRLIDPKSKSNLLYVSNLAFEQMQRIPTIEAEPVKHGRWLYVCGKGRHAEYECSECKIHVHFDEKIDGSIPPYKRCPECGAKMDLEE